MRNFKLTGLSCLTLFLSVGTLLCCALPIVLVLLGLGAALASLVSQFPVLIYLSQNKIWIFLISGGLLWITAWLLWRPARTCPTDPKLAAWCEKIQFWNIRIFWSAVVIWMIGFVTAYLLSPIYSWLF